MVIMVIQLNEINPASSATCSHCNDQDHEDLQHALLQCSYNDVVGQSLLNGVQTQVGNSTPQSSMTSKIII